MNMKLILKTLLLILVLLFLVLMGMDNRKEVDFYLPHFLPKKIKIVQPAAIMYYAFFAIGLFTGTLLTAGGGKKGGQKTNKVDK